MTVAKSFKRFNWGLYLALLLTAAFPTAYTTARIHFLGDLPSDWGFNIASQLAWVNLALEVIQEALLLPLFHCIGLTIANRGMTVRKVRSGIIVTLLVHAVFAAIILLFADSLVAWMAQKPGIVDETARYIRLEMAGTVLFALARFLGIVFILMNLRFHIYAILAIHAVLSVCLDAFFISSLEFSLELGVNGIAYSNAIAALAACAYSVVVFSKTVNMRLVDWRARRSDFGWMRVWAKVDGFSGVDSLVRNAFYLLFISRMMNVVEEQGTYWIANGFIWGWLLLPLFPLADLLKRDVAGMPVIDHREKTAAYFGIAAGLCTVWVATIPGWGAFAGAVLNAPNPEKIVALVLLLLPFYALFCFNTLMDSVFYGRGRTELLALQSLITNVAVYGVAFVLFQAGIFAPTLKSVALLFGAGIAVDSLITFVMYRNLLAKTGGML